MIVEDDKKLAGVMKRVLRQEGHAAEVAYDGEEALDLLDGGSFDVVILDVMLPKLLGTDVCRRARESGNNSAILMLTALDSTEDKVLGLDAGADDYLAKPFAFAELLARIRALSRRRAPVVSDVLRAGDIVLDPSKHEVMRAGERIDLTPTEFALLQFLMQNKGHALSREQILDNVWGYDFAPAANVVDIYVHYLRNKVDKGKAKRLIHTIRGIGYRLSEAS
jgi:DNA-binding response OmpR family regulator